MKILIYLFFIYFLPILNESKYNLYSHLMTIKDINKVAIIYLW